MDQKEDLKIDSRKKDGEEEREEKWRTKNRKKKTGRKERK